MDDYEAESVPFYFNPDTSVALFRGLRTRDRLPVVLKRHDFTLILHKEVQVRMVQTLNAAVAQAKVRHPNACDLLEVQLEIERTNCSIYHVLESLETDLARDIEVHRQTRSPFGEGELRAALLQTASVLAAAHSNNIPHRDVKPTSIFRTAGTYKLGDFGSFFMKRDTSGTKSDMRYMSPQLREACVRGTAYNAFKSDVFALGASILHMATLTSPELVTTADLLKKAVDMQINSLSCSALLKNLLKRMLGYSEGPRPTMREVCAVLAQTEESQMSQSPEQAELPSTLAGVCHNKAFLYEIQSKQLFTRTLSVDFSEGGSYVQADRNTLLCVGDRPPSSAVYSLALSSFQLSPLPPLSTARGFAGLAKVNAHFYVFGGVDSNYDCLNSCEKMQLPSQRWTQINSMAHPRGAFTPCHFRSLLYLASANIEAQRTLETFNVETESFTLLPVSLPPELYYGESVAFIANGELCVLTSCEQIARWKIETAREFHFYSTGRICWSCQQPLIVGSLVLIVCLGEVQKFSLETYSFID